MGRAVREPAARARRPNRSFRPPEERAEGTEIAFQWRPASDPDGDAIADYHFELSARADMKWPLSMSFAKLISRTADAGQARYTLPRPRPAESRHEVLLARPGARMTRGSGDRGVQPGASRRGDRHLRKMSASNSTASATGASSTGRRTRWAASPWRTVSMPATRRASPSATGPTRSRWEYPRRCPRSSPRTSWSKPRPPSWRWWALHVKLPGANKAFYRVVAVDAAGNRSGPSDYAAAPRPVIVSAPVTDGQERGGLSLSGRGHPIAG